MNEKTTAVEKDKAVSEILSEYKIGHTTYVVKTTFNPAFQESLSDILKRLIIRECDSLLGKAKHQTEKQAV